MMSRAGRPIIVVVGSLHYDIMVDAPDRPRKGETVAGFAWRPKFGGKGGNQACAAAKAGAEVRMVSAVGDDEFGRFLVAELERCGVDASRVSRVSEQGSGMSVAISDAEGDYGAVIVSGANLMIDSGALADGVLWQGAGILILQNEVPDALNLAGARSAKAAGVSVCLNAAPYRPLSDDLAALVDVLVVNAIEAEDLGSGAVTDLASAAAAAERLTGRFASVVVTAGGDGVAGKERGYDTITIPALPVTLVTTHGAGDSFVGTLATALAEQMPFADAIRTANAAAAAHVSRQTA